MTGRYFAYDIREKIETLLNDVATGFNVLISTINTERTHTAPSAKSISHAWGKNQFPLLLIEIKDSEVIYGESSLDTNIKHLPEVYNIQIVGFIKSADSARKDWVEDWLEAMIRVLHNYNDENITWIMLKRTDRDEINTEENQWMNMFFSEYEARIN